MIIIVDFGSQTANLIARRIRDLGVTVTTVIPEQALAKIKELDPRGIIFSGGPASVYGSGAPTIDPKIFLDQWLGRLTHKQWPGLRKK